MKRGYEPSLALLRKLAEAYETTVPLLLGGAEATNSAAE